MVMKKFFLVVFSLFLILSPNFVKADTLPSFNINISTFTNLNNNFNYDKTYQQFLDQLINLESNYYNISIYHSTNNIIVYLVPTASSTFVIRNMVANTTNYFKLYFATSQSIKKYTFTTSSTSSDYSSFLNCYQNNSSCVSSTTVLGKDDTTYYQSGSAYSTTNNYNNEYSNQSFWYYSSVPLEYEINYNTYDSFFSSYLVNGTLIENGTSIPTYYDLYMNNPGGGGYEPIVFDEDYLTDLGTFHIGGLSENEFRNFTLSSSFVPSVTSSSDYQLSTLVYKYGRISESGYYKYELINDCTSTGSFSSSSNGVTFNFSNNFCTSDLSAYDRFYITIWNYDPTNTLDLTLSGLPVTTTSGGYIYRGVSFDFGLYELHNNLSNDFTYFISSSSSSTKVFVTSPNTSVITGLYDLNNTKFISNYGSFGGSFYNSYIIGTSNQKGLYIASNTTQNNIELGMFLSEDTIISYDYNDNYTYYNNSGQITTVSSITIDESFSKVITPDTQSYDVSYYFGKVNDFIYSLSNDINTFSNLVQDFYNSAPVFLQTFIYVVFILFCSYFVYLMIRK